MTALPKRYYTPEEYLELEEKAAYKSEYFDGHACGKRAFSQSCESKRFI